MATEYLFSNNATTTLAQSVSATATVLNVAEGTGNLFPSPSSGQAFAVTLVDAATGLTNEICYCTSRSGDQLTVVRGREGTNAIAWSAGDTCANYITADVMESWLQESDLNGYLTQSNADNRYVRFIDDSVNWPVQYIGVNKSTNAPWFRSGPNYYMLQPAGDYATNSALNGYLKNANGGIGGEQSGTSLVYQTSAGRPFFSYNNNGSGGNLAWYSDVTAEAATRANADSNLQNQINGKQPAGNYVSASQYSDDFSTSDSRVINLPYGHRLQGFIVAVSGSGVHNIYFPVAFSSVPETIVISQGLTNGNNASVSVLGGWTATGFQIQTNGDTSVNFLAMGAK